MDTLRWLSNLRAGNMATMLKTAYRTEGRATVLHARPLLLDAFDSRPDRRIGHNFASMMVKRSGDFKPFDSADSWIVKYEGRQRLQLIQCKCFGLLTESGRRVG